MILALRHCRGLRSSQPSSLHGESEDRQPRAQKFSCLPKVFKTTISFELSRYERLWGFLVLLLISSFKVLRSESGTWVIASSQKLKSFFSAWYMANFCT